MYKYIILPVVTGLLLSGCASKDINSVKKFGCEQESVSAPEWTCVPQKDGYYVGVGISKKSQLGESFMRRNALANGRSELAQQIKVNVKDKVESFSRSTGVEEESIDKVVTTVTKQIANVNLYNSRAIDSWNSPSGSIYLLVAVDKIDVNDQIGDNISSFNNKSSLHQHLLSTEAISGLMREFKEK